MDIVTSKNRIPIRLTDERWVHIIENHDDLAGHYDDVLYAIEDPDYIIEGYRKALIALKKIARTKFLAVVYREISREDGFVITAYFTGRLNLEKEVILWQKKS
jgi:hypothetical protein